MDAKNRTPPKEPRGPGGMDDDNKRNIEDLVAGLADILSDMNEPLSEPQIMVIAGFMAGWIIGRESE